MYSITTEDKQYKFTVTKRTSMYGYNIWILSEYSLPDNEGIYQRVKLIAKFGNTANKESYTYARACANALCDAWNN